MNGQCNSNEHSINGKCEEIIKCVKTSKDEDSYWNRLCPEDQTCAHWLGPLED